MKDLSAELVLELVGLAYNMPLEASASGVHDEGGRAMADAYTGARERRARNGRGPSLGALFDDWLRRLEGERSPGSEPATKPAEPPKEDPAPREPSEAPSLEGVRLRGGSVTFADAPGDRVELRLRPSAVEHGGVVAVRGPLSTLLPQARDAGLAEAQARALEFVAAWFGAPFDAVSAPLDAERPLAWGFLRFGGTALTRCFTAWKRRDAASFKERLGRYGLDCVAMRADGGVEEQDLQVLDPVSGDRASGRAAEQVVAAEPRWIAVLARAGRHPASQAAQVEAAVSEHLRPALSHELTAGTTLGAALRSSPALAALFYTELALGARGARAFAEACGANVADPGAEDDWVERFAARLERLRHGEHASALRRILSSPELR